MLYAYRLVLLEMSILKEHCQKQQRQQPSIRVWKWTIMIDVNQKKVPQSFLECPFIFHIHNHKKGIKSAIILILKKKCKKNEQLTAFLWFFFFFCLNLFYSLWVLSIILDFCSESFLFLSRFPLCHQNGTSDEIYRISCG